MMLLTCSFWNDAAVAESSNLGDQLFKLTADDAAAFDYFGQSVAISGNTAIIGARYDNDSGSDSGSAYIFDVPTGNQIMKLTAGDAASEDYFGSSVAISGNTAIVGADGDDGAGSAYIFDVTTGNQIMKLTGGDAAAGDCFGVSVAINGNIAIVGADRDNAAGIIDSGSAYIFDVTTGNQLLKLTADDAAAGDFLGISVAINENTAIVGAEGDDDAGSLSGSAYLFDVTTGNQLLKLTADDADSLDSFGLSVAISENTAIIGTFSAAAYLFDMTTGNQLAKLTADGFTDNPGPFGTAVAISGNIAIVGNQATDSFSGSAYLFDVSTGIQLAKLTADDAETFVHFGISVAISGNTALVGASFDDDTATSSGSAYLFDTSSPLPVRLVSFQVWRSELGAVLVWEISDASDHAGFHVYRQTAGAERERLTDSLLRGQTAYRFTDESPPTEGAEYWLAEISRTGKTIWYGPAVLSPVSLSAGLTLGPGVPNPFRSRTQISYSIPVAEHVELSIYDLHGRRVATLVDREQGLGTYTESWDGRVDTGRAASGLYFLRLRVGKATKIQKLMFVR